MVILTAAVVMGVCSRCGAAGKLTKYTTKYYVLHTDLDKDMTREVVVRITAMAEEYNNRCKSFAGRINTRFPLFLYKNRKDYLRHPGVVKGSSGTYSRRSLIAVAPRPGGSWHVVQHEGFHQFAHRMIRGHLPTWLNEGLATYFGAGVWTGDSLVVGAISRHWLKRVKSMIDSGKLMPLDKMLDMKQKEWNDKLKSQNYLQARSMVHFLVHADKGKYQTALSSYIRDLSQGRSSSAAFRKRFGKNVKAFQDRYIQWWSKLKGDPTAELYDRIKVLTLTSFLARAHYTGRKFENIEAFFKAARDGTFTKVFAEIGKRNPAIWLPESLLTGNIPRGDDVKRWSLVHQERAPTHLKLAPGDGASLLGSFKLGPRITVTVKTVRPAATRPASKPAVRTPFPPELIPRL
jgi:hypothetical protein